MPRYEIWSHKNLDDFIKIINEKGVRIIAMFPKYNALFTREIDCYYAVIEKEDSKKSVPKSEEAFCKTDMGLMREITPTDLKEVRKEVE